MFWEWVWFLTVVAFYLKRWTQRKATHFLYLSFALLLSPSLLCFWPYSPLRWKLQTMEKHKVAYLRYFIVRVNIELEKFQSTIKEMEATIRCCYAETSLRSISSDDFMNMILQDAIFILELFHICYTGSWERDDLMPTNLWMSAFLRLDLVLLENQLPFFVLEKLYNLAFDHHSNFPSLIWELFHRY